MQAIHTRYVGPTNTRGSRIIAECDRGKITVSYPYGERDPHIFAARALCAKFVAEDLKRGDTQSVWSRPFISGGLPGNRGECHVFVA